MTTTHYHHVLVAPVQSITGTLLLGFLIYTAPRNVYLILNYHLFLRQEYFFELLYLSEYDIRMFLFVISLRNGPSIKYVRN